MRRRACLVAALALLIVPASAAAPNADIVARQLDEQRSARQRALAQAAEAETRATQMAARARTIEDAAERDSVALASLGLRIQAAEAELSAARGRVAILRQLEAAQRRRLAAQQRPVAELMASLQLLTRRPPLSLFAQPGATLELVHTRAMIEAVLPEIRRRTAGLRVELARSHAIAAAQARAEAAQRASAASLAERRTQLARSEARQRIRAAALASSAGLEGDRSRALGAEASDISDLLGRIEVAGSLRDRLARLPGPQPRPGSVASGGDPVGGAPRASGPPAYRLPVVGDVVRGLGELDGDGARSRGLTIAAPPSAQIVAPAAGRIVFAGEFRTYGRIVIIDHGGGWTSLVTNLIAISAEVGDVVAQGAPIGRAGPDRPRITVELRRAGQPVDIATLIS